MAYSSLLQSLKNKKGIRARERERSFRRVAKGQPVCTPYDHFRTIHVKERQGAWSWLLLCPLLPRFQPVKKDNMTFELAPPPWFREVSFPSGKLRSRWGGHKTEGTPP